MHSALRTDQLRHAARNVASTHANIGHLIAGLELQALDEFSSIFLPLTFRAFQPSRALMPHHV